MSIVRMRKQFRKKIRITLGSKKMSIGSPMEIIFWFIVLIFLVGAYYTFGAPPTGETEDPTKAGRKVTKNIATVNGKAIARAEFEERLAFQTDNMPTAELPTNGQYLKSGILDGMIQRIVMLDAAKQEGVSVSREDINKKVDELVQEQITTRYPDRKAIAKALKKKNMTLDQLKREIRGNFMKDPEGVKETLLFEKLEEKVKSRVTMTDDELKEEYAKVKARHILITAAKLKEKDEEKATADAEKAKPGDKAAADKAKAEATKGKDYKAAAKKLAEELLARAKKGEDFAALAKEYSADTGSAAKGGMLGSNKPPAPGSKEGPSEYFGRREMVPEFDKAAFSLKPDQISEIVETDYGYHIIQVLDRKVELPDDFDKKKKEYKDQALEQKKNQTWTDYSKDLEKKAAINVDDPELAAYRAMKDDDKAKALGLLQQAANADPRNVSVKYQLAMIYKDQGDKAKAIEQLKALAEDEQAAASVQVRMDLAELLSETGDKKGALEQYKAASDWAQAFDYQNMFQHQQIKTKAEELGDKELAKQEQKWLDEYQANQAQQGMGGMGGMGGLTIPVTPSSSK